MNKSFKKFKIVIPIMMLLSLCACTIQIETSTSSSSFETSSSSSSSSSEDISEGLHIILGNKNLSLGKTFMDGGYPFIYLDGEEIDIDDLTSYTLKKGKSLYGIYDPFIEAGTYTFTAKKGSLSAVVSFAVSEGEAQKASEKKGYTTVSQADAEKYSLHNVPYAGALNLHKMPSIGTVKLLVIPVTFTNGPKFTSNELAAIEKGYFGKASETGWQSLASFYEESSYGKLHITGEITDTYVSSLTENQLQNDFLESSDLATREIVNAAVEYIFENNPSLDRASFDTDNDGFLDGVEIIYKTNKYRTGYEDGSGVWWNFTGAITSNEGNLENPNGYRYFWSNISQMTNNYYSTNIDAHTLIHETGHMLGLNDYYDYQTETYPTGGVDMMELNIGDHSAYSKYLLGWVTPKVIDGSLNDFEITLSSFEESGDCIILRDTTTDPWNGTPYDEYLMLSYYTPTGLNEKDSKGYQEWVSSGYGTGGTYKYRGLQVYHIDERLYTLVGSKYNAVNNQYQSTKYSYTDDILGELEIDDNKNVTRDYARQASSNTTAYSIEVNSRNAFTTNSNNKEITIIPASADASLFVTSSKDKRCRNLGSDEVLMGLGDYGSEYNGFSFKKMQKCFPKETSFNDGSNIEYNFFVSEQISDSITIRFVREE